MTDRELLELAAKAAGIDYDETCTEKDYKFGLWLTMHGEPYEGQRRKWNPLTDDGDAFRLVVKLRFWIKDFAPHDSPELADLPAFGMVEIWREDDDDPIYVEWYKPSDGRYAATRRAIVRAAALIGGSK